MASLRFAQADARRGRHNEHRHPRAIPLTELDEQERKLVRVYYDDRLSPDLYNEERARIRRERQQTEAIAKRLSFRFEDLQRTLELALTIVADAENAYLTASPQIRRLMNQAIFARIEIRDDEQVEGQRAEPFAALLSNEIFETAREGDDPDSFLPAIREAQSINDRGPDPWGSEPLVGSTALPIDPNVAGSMSLKVMGAAGFEPATCRV